MTKLHVELDGPLRAGALVVKDGEAQTDVTSLSLCLDSQSGAQVITLDRVAFMGGTLWHSGEGGVITKLTITAEYEEVQ